MENLKSLIKRAQDGDLEAFSGIVIRFQDMAVGYAYSILGDFQLAEDAAQEAFIEVYHCLLRISNPDTFSGLFRKIIFKHCNRLTRGKRIKTVPLEAAIEAPSREKGPSDVVLEQELKDSVFQAIQALPESQRTVTMLFYINGYSQNEISDFLEIPVTTVKKRLQYSRKRLKERMIKMVQDTIHENRPSRDGQFVDTVKKTLVVGSKPVVGSVFGKNFGAFVGKGLKASPPSVVEADIQQKLEQFSQTPEDNWLWWQLSDDLIIEKSPADADTIYTIYYLPQRRWKVVRHNKGGAYFGEELSWYIYIADITYEPAYDCWLVTDLLTQVMVGKDERRHSVMNLDRLAEAFEKELITKNQVVQILRDTQALVDLIRSGNFPPPEIEECQ
ncbi:MAG: RNA polymerase sigma factor, partial [Candidatus Poribacteria bacterium]